MSGIRLEYGKNALDGLPKMSLLLENLEIL